MVEDVHEHGSGTLINPMAPEPRPNVGHHGWSTSKKTSIRRSRAYMGPRVGADEPPSLMKGSPNCPRRTRPIALQKKSAGAKA